MTGARSSASTLELFVLSTVVSLVFGTLLVFARVGPVPVLATGGAAYVTLVRNPPLLVVFIFVFVAIPRLELDIDSFLLEGVMGLSLYTSAFVCEAMRSGINSVPLGQAEASGRSG